MFLSPVPTTMPPTLMSAAALAARDRCVILDCRFQLTDPDYGRRAYAAGHVPGAHYLHLDDDLSGAKTGANGRHPLPEPARLAARLGALGVSDDTLVVAYDDAGGMFAARAWWLLRLLGHEQVVVLDGGVAAWLAAGLPLTGAASPAHPARFTRRAPLVATVSTAQVEVNLQQPAFTLVDARAPTRFAGKDETLDPVGGHIPGALNYFFQANFGPDGTFLPPAQLAERWRALLGTRAPHEVVHQCGSGVSACVNLLAMEHAGLTGSRLYPGSWSAWCSDPQRPVATG